jgi:hypothetical protein
MKHDDVQLGRPEIVYKDTKANVEAIASPVEGMTAEATDTHRMGYYTGSAWLWEVASGVDSGATLPASPFSGQLFLHTPTGRSVLMQYVGATWYPIVNFGSMTLYVDGTDGTDSADKGYGVDAAAYKTLTYMWMQIPGMFYGDITIYVAAGTYSETLNCYGKMAGGNYTINLIGELSTLVSGNVTSSVQGTGATVGSVTDATKAYTVDEHKGKFVVTNYGTRVIKSNTTDTLVIASCFTGAPSGAFTIVEPSTIVDGGAARSTCITVSNYQIVKFTNFKVQNSTSYDIYVLQFAFAWFVQCILKPASGKFPFTAQGCKTTFEYCTCVHNGAGYNSVYSMAIVNFRGSVCYQSVGSKSGNCFVANQMADILFGIGNDFSNFSTVFSLTDGVSVNTTSSATNGYNFIHDNTTGISATTGSRVIGTANNQYSGNSTDEYAQAATFAYID